MAKATPQGGKAATYCSQAGRLLTRTYGSLSIFVALLCAAVSVAGISVLLTLALLRYHASEDADILRPLVFDYSAPVAIASASLLAPHDAKGGLRQLLPWPFARAPAYQQQLSGPYDFMWSDTPPHAPQKSKWFGSKAPAPSWDASAALPHAHQEARVFEAGREFNVHARLQLPAQYAELFQITGELLTTDNKVVARAARTHLPKPQPPLRRLLRALFWFPLYFVGYYERTQDAQFLLFNRYREKLAAPVTRVRVYLKSRNTSVGSLPPPPVHEANLRVQQRLSMVRTLISWVRPSLTTTILLGAIAGAVAGAGSAATVGAIGVAFILYRLSRKAPAPTPQPEEPETEPPLPESVLEPASPPSEEGDYEPPPRVVGKQHRAQSMKRDAGEPTGLEAAGEAEVGSVEESGVSTGGVSSVGSKASSPWSEDSQSPEAGPDGQSGASDDGGGSQGEQKKVR